MSYTITAAETAQLHSFKDKWRWTHQYAEETPPPTGRYTLKVTAGSPDAMRILGQVLPRVSWQGDSPENIRFFGDKVDTDAVKYHLAQCNWQLVPSNSQQNFSAAAGHGQGNLQSQLIAGVLNYVHRPA